MDEFHFVPPPELPSFKQIGITQAASQHDNDGPMQCSNLLRDNKLHNRQDASETLARYGTRIQRSHRRERPREGRGDVSVKQSQQFVTSRRRIWKRRRKQKLWQSAVRCRVLLQQVTCKKPRSELYSCLRKLCAVCGVVSSNTSNAA